MRQKCFLTFRCFATATSGCVVTELRRAESSSRIYLARRDGRCGIVNRDVVKLEVDLHCEKKPACFPFPVKPKRMRGVRLCTVEPTQQKVWVAARVTEEVLSH